MSQVVKSFVAAGIVGAVVWAFKREAERAAGQGAEIIPASAPAAPDTSAQERKQKLLKGFEKLFWGAFDDHVERRPQSRTSQIVRGLKSRGQPSNIGNQLMTDLMRDFGLAKHQAAGIVGNLDHESGGFKSLQEIAPMIKGSRGGYGYAQWTGPRRRQFEAWINRNGLDARSYAANYGFLKHELTNTGEKRVLSRLRRAKTVDEATRIFSGSSQKGNAWDGFLRPGIPHMRSRYQRARRYA